MADLIYIIVPVFNEEKNIFSFLRKLSIYSKNIIVVNDGSTDKTQEILNASNLDVFNHPKNLGKGAAMKTGIEAAIIKKADSVIFIDADGQHKPKETDLFVKELNKGYDFVFGSRKYSSSIPLIKNIGKNIVTNMINIILRTNRSDVLCGFFALKIKNYSLVKWSSNGYGVETEISIKAAKKRLKFSEIFINSNYYNKKNGISAKDIIPVIFRIPRWIIF